MGSMLVFPQVPLTGISADKSCCQGVVGGGEGLGNLGDLLYSALSEPFVPAGMSPLQRGSSLCQIIRLQFLWNHLYLGSSLLLLG